MNLYYLIDTIEKDIISFHTSKKEAEKAKKIFFDDHEMHRAQIYCNDEDKLFDHLKKKKAPTAIDAIIFLRRRQYNIS